MHIRFFFNFKISSRLILLITLPILLSLTQYKRSKKVTTILWAHCRYSCILRTKTTSTFSLLQYKHGNGLLVGHRKAWKSGGGGQVVMWGGRSALLADIGLTYMSKSWNTMPPPPFRQPCVKGDLFPEDNIMSVTFFIYWTKSLSAKFSTDCSKYKIFLILYLF